MLHVDIYLRKADTCRHTFADFFSLFGAYTAILGDWQFEFQKKELIKYPNKVNLEGQIIVMILLPLFGRMLYVVLGLMARLDGTLRNLSSGMCSHPW